MKNTFSKTLICGIIASSFILVNCQKAPTGRGVKGTAGTPQTPADKAAEAAKAVVVVKCSPEFAKEYSAWITLMDSEDVKNLENAKVTDELTEDQIVEFKKLRKHIESKTENLMPEIKKMREDQEKVAKEKKQEVKKLDGCFNESGGKRVDLIFDNLEKSANGKIAKIRKFDGVESDRTKKHDEEIETNHPHSVVTKNAKYYVSAELNKALDSADMDETFFKNGRVLVGEQEKKKAIAAPTITVCYMDKSSGKIEDLDVTLNSIGFEKDGQVGTKTRYKIMMLSGDSDYAILCVLPAKKLLSAGFRDAMGALLQTKEQREKAKVKETEKAEAAKSVEDQKKSDKDAKDKKAADAKADKAVEEKAKKEIIEKVKKDNKKPLTDEEMKVAVKKALEELQAKTKKPEIKVLIEKEMEDVTKADQDAAEKARKQREEQNIKAMEEESGT